MTGVFREGSIAWALALVVIVPLLIVAAGELDERLRQRDSALRPVVAVLRWWTLPLFAFWVIATAVFTVPSNNVVIRLVATGVLLSAAVAALAAVRVVIARYRRRRGAQTRGGVPQLVLVLPRLAVVLAVGWVLLDRVWGVDLSAALTALGVTSLVVSFALQDTLSGLASGLLLVGDAPFAPGDWILYGEDAEGRVVDINWRSTRIENRNGDLVVVPNATLSTATLVNFDRPTRVHRVVVPVQVAYVNPPTRAKAMLLDAARSTPHVLEDPAPGVRVVQIDDPLMGYEVELWIDDYRLAPRVSSEFGALVWYQSHRHDVPLPSPAYDLYVYDGVAAGETATPSRAEVTRRLRTSHLLETLDDAAIGALAAAGTSVRFALGETIVSTADVGADLYVLWDGHAQVVVRADDGDPVSAGEFSAGDIFGLLARAAGTETTVAVTATTDCEVVVVEAAAAADVLGRDTKLSAAVERTFATQRRRVERVVQRLDELRTTGADSMTNDGEAETEAEAEAATVEHR
jgi:small-conductance mechanosensitive channel/CRP-like cAMP-binding protein